MPQDENVLDLHENKFSSLKNKIQKDVDPDKKTTRGEPTIIRTEPAYLKKLHELLGSNYESTGRALFITGGAVKNNLDHEEGSKATIELAAKGLYLEMVNKKQMVVIATMPADEAKELMQTLSELKISFTSLEA